MISDENKTKIIRINVKLKCIPTGLFLKGSDNTRFIIRRNFWVLYERSRRFLRRTRWSMISRALQE